MSVISVMIINQTTFNNIKDRNIKVLKCLNQCFAQLHSQESVSSKTAADPANRFGEFQTLFPILKSFKTLI